MKRTDHVIVMVIFAFSLCGCSSSVFNIRVSPEGSLIRQKEFMGFIDVDTSRAAGISRKVIFVGSTDSVAFMAMKRGYREDTVWIKKGSLPDVTIKLEKIPEINPVNDKIINPGEARVLVLPLVVDAVLHKGVGNLDRYENSAEDSENISASLKRLLNNEFQPATGIFQLFYSPLFNSADTAKIPDEVVKYLLSIKPNLLKYYGIPPSVSKYYNRNRNFKALSPLMDPLNNSLMVVVYCRTIKPTGGRIAGNIVMGLASAAVPSSTIDPEAFNLDSSSLLSAYYFHPGTGEVVAIRQKTLPYDLFSEKAQISGIKELVKLLESK